MVKKYLYPLSNRCNNCLLYLSLFVISPTVFSIESIQLTDVIKSNGFGEINLLKDVTPSDLETFRLDNGEKLIFAIDVNEASSGTEKASSQAVTIKSVEVIVMINGVESVFNNFTTETQALVAEAPETQRSLYYTAIGNTGSNRITANNIIQEKFDSNITIPVDIELSLVDSAILKVTLLETNSGLGDPEAFYDFSNGYEDLAIVNNTDKDYFDSESPGRDEAPTVVLTNTSSQPDPLAIVSQIYTPSSTSYYLVAYEDKFPMRGDYDFNDLTVAYQTTLNLNANNEIVSIAGVAYLVTRGAEYNHDWYLSIPIPQDSTGSLEYTLTPPANSNSLPKTGSSLFTGELNVKAFSETKFIFYDPGYFMVNTLLEQALVLGPKYDFIARFDKPIPQDQVGDAPFDPYLYVYNTGYEIHLPDFTPKEQSQNVIDGLHSFRDSNGFPFAMLIPDTWEPPLEQTELLTAYPDFGAFVTSSGNQKKNWYSNSVQGKVKKLSDINWRW